MTKVDKNGWAGPSNICRGSNRGNYPFRSKIEMKESLKFANTKWGVSNWTKEQKIQFQEECFRLGYKWFLGGREIESLDFLYYVLHANGDMTGWRSLVYFNKLGEMKWTDMFPKEKEKEMKESLKFANTKWDARSWIQEQRIQFQEECFRLGYKWLDSGQEIQNAYLSFIFLCEDGGITHTHELYRFKRHCSREMKRTDMFPEASIEVGNPINIIDHDCSLYYSRTMDTCLKCHPERDLRDPKNSKNLWGILDTARRE